MYVLVGVTARYVCIGWRDCSVCMYLLEGQICVHVFVGGTALYECICWRDCSVHKQSHKGINNNRRGVAAVQID